jgi:hypothetical protein
MEINNNNIYYEKDKIDESLMEIFSKGMFLNKPILLINYFSLYSMTSMVIFNSDLRYIT